MSLFDDIAGATRPDSQRRPVRYIKLVMGENQVIAELKDGYKLGYSRQFNYVKVMRNEEELRCEIVREGYTLNEFIDRCFYYSRIYNYLP